MISDVMDKSENYVMHSFKKKNLCILLDHRHELKLQYIEKYGENDLIMT